MSVNDLLDSDIVIPAILVIFVLLMIIAIPVGLALGKRTNNDIYGDDEDGAANEENNAKIVAKRTTPHPLNQTVMINTVVFELDDGMRIELAIKDSNAYGIMLEGDCGTLKYQGKRFVGFERGSNHEA